MPDPGPREAEQNPPPEEEAERGSPRVSQGRTIRSEDLFAGHRVVRIQHAGGEYRLMITRNDRLILQK